MNYVSKILVASVAVTRQLRLMSLFSILPAKTSSSSVVCINSSGICSNLLHPNNTCPNFFSLRNASGWGRKETRKDFYLTAEEFKKAIENDDIYVIDVREPHEVDEGRVPAKRWANVPVGLLFPSLIILSEERFKERFGIAKPSMDEKIVLMCRSGARSSMGLHIVQEMGYGNSKHYLGGWLEWSKTYPGDIV